MNLHPDQLKALGYQLLDELEHKELVPFVKKYIRKNTVFAWLYYIATFGLLAISIGLIVKGFLSENFKLMDLISKFSLGFALALLLLPLHEYLHALAYKFVGATTTSYDANLKKFYFMAIADKFVANRKEFNIVALAPFVVISSGLMITLLFVGFNWQITILGVLFAHTSMCSGDFALLSYFQFHRDKQVVTYDLKHEKVSYFYFLP